MSLIFSMHSKYKNHLCSQNMISDISFNELDNRILKTRKSDTSVCEGNLQVSSSTHRCAESKTWPLIQFSKHTSSPTFSIFSQLTHPSISTSASSPHQLYKSCKQAVSSISDLILMLIAQKIDYNKMRQLLLAYGEE